MDITKLVRTENKVIKELYEVKDKLLCKKEAKVYIPEDYFQKGLAIDGEELKILAHFPIVVGNNYEMMNANCMVSTNPSIINRVEIEGVKFREYTYELGDAIIDNLNILKSPTLVYDIFYEIKANGHIPWYFNKDDLLGLFRTAEKYGNAKFDVDNAILELIASVLVRSPKDRKVLYRNLEKWEDHPLYVALKSVGYGATNTTAKLIGADFQEGVTSALTNVSKNNETIEDALRE